MTEDSKSVGFWQTVPGIITAFAGIITAIGGLLLVLFQIGFFGGKTPQNNPAQVPSDRVNSSSSTNVSQTPQTNAVTRTEQTEANQVDISGTWYDTYGVVYSIEQNGDHFSGESNYQGIRSEGSGVLIGRAYESGYRSTRPSTGRCKGTVSSDGRSISVDCWDSAIGYFSTRMSRDR